MKYNKNTYSQHQESALTFKTTELNEPLVITDILHKSGYLKWLSESDLCQHIQFRVQGDLTNHRIRWYDDLKQKVSCVNVQIIGSV